MSDYLSDSSMVKKLLEMTMRELLSKSRTTFKPR
jgi:hypothetical protein